ncbi:UDP-glucose:glycoprotein glucosyltransferase-domain-containing protein [Zopfochytrium polystomum]|nr:UDP-glucose:glycoprotein glucosyltransferase-domain-containing protein [Zopfochytrium polystomum]
MPRRTASGPLAICERRGRGPRSHARLVAVATAALSVLLAASVSDPTLRFLGGMIAVSASDTTPSPPVVTTLQTGWPSPPIALEVLEFVSQENEAAYFPFLDWMIENDLLSKDRSDRDVYEGAVRGIDAVPQLRVHAATRSLLDLSMRVRSGAPAVHAYYQFYSDVVVPKTNASLSNSFDLSCDVWIDLGGHQLCSLQSLEAALKDRIDIPQPPSLQFDHVYKESSSLPRAILYADLRSRQFPKFHEALKKLADNGLLAYVLRYRSPPISSDASPLVVAGYGVELALKSTEYKVIDDRNVGAEKADSENEDEATADEPVEKGNPLEVLFEEGEPTVQSLTGEEIRELAVKAAHLVLASDEPLSLLTAISQDLPKLSHVIAKTAASGRIRMALRKNLMTLATAGTMKLFMNGMDIPVETLDFFSLLQRMRNEAKLVHSIAQLNFTSSEIFRLLSSPSGSSGIDLGWGEAFDIRDENLLWWNDLEKDKRYKSWPKSVRDLLRPGYPGQPRYIRKNLFSVLFAMDLTKLENLEVLTNVFNFVERDIPLRFGVIPVISSSDGSTSTWLCRGLYHILESHGRKGARQFLMKLYSIVKENFGGGGQGTASLDVINQAFQSVVGEELTSSLAKENDQLKLAAVRSFQSRLGLQLEKGAYFLNGKYTELDETWQQYMLNHYAKMLEFLQQSAYTGSLTDADDVLDFFMNQGNVRKRRNPYIFPSDSNPLRFINLLGGDVEGEVLDSLLYVTSPEVEGLGASKSVIVIADLSDPSGLQKAKGALEFISTAASARVAFIHNPTGDVHTLQKVTLLHEAVAKLSMQDPSSALAHLLENLPSAVEEGSGEIVLQGDSDTPALAIEKLNDDFSKQLSFARSVVGAGPGETFILVNGRIVGPIPASFSFDKEDYELLVSTEFDTRIKNIERIVTDILESKGTLSLPPGWFANTVMKVSSTVSHTASVAPIEPGQTASPRLTLSSFINWNDNPLAFTVGDPSASIIRFTAILDPAAEFTQKVSHILEVVSKLEGVSVQVLLHPSSVLTELPVKRFYRYVLQKQLSFDESGALLPASATFKNLPKDPLLTLGLDVPDAWLVRAIESVHDLDNIKLANLQGEHARRGVDALFQLVNILVQGHVNELQTPMPPRGLQFILGTPSVPHMVDTITMTNLGYIQLKANPGVWELRLREGRSQKVYQLVGVSDTRGKITSGSEVSEDGVARVIVNSFEGLTIYATAKKRPGMETADVLEPDEPEVKEAEPNLWEKVKSRVGSVFGSTPAPPPSRSNATINVFSVASGHLYERFLGIMMLTVVKNTKNPVKFWLIENFLSPSFMKFIPHLAKAYNFEYELVTYKWPQWLRGQTEKQRFIWGYKILFLDVLFPLDLEKVIFVDADQIVRVDLKELVDTDLQGAVYGYTPRGYWKSHLGPRPYHISALYVVDLKRFRQLLAGDRLRQQYQMLSADPNSLANLDQDLPNNMIHQIPIFSLSQEWLWCETWCSDAELSKAKTIDLCNNPLTKEPKLERAKRIVPEWESLDEEVQSVARRVREETTTTAPAAGSGSTSAHRQDEL